MASGYGILLQGAHEAERTALHTPSADDFSGDLNRVSHARVTHKTFSDGCTSQVTDEWGMVREADESNDQHGRGFTLFKYADTEVELSTLPQAPVECDEYKAFVSDRILSPNEPFGEAGGR